MLSERRYVFLVKVIDNNGKYTLNEMASFLQVSVRTIRNDIISINEFLKRSNLPLLGILDGILRIDGNINLSELHDIQSDFNDVDGLYEYRLTKEERIIFIATILLSASNYITFEKIADQLYVSRSTIINDFEDVKQMVKKKECTIASYANKGLLVFGKERNKRALLLELLFTGITSYHNSSYPYHILKFLNTDFSTSMDDKVILSEIVTTVEQKYYIKYTDDSFQKLIYYLIIMIRRVIKGCFIEMDKDKTNTLEISESIMDSIIKKFRIKPTKDELLELSDFMSNLRATGQDIGKSRVVVDIQILTRKFIEQISEELSVDLTNDYEFFQNLSFHFESFLRTPFNTQNPLILDILESSPEIVEAVKNNISIFENYAKRKSNELEKSYIVVHICAAIERKQSQNSDLSVAIITNVGLGPSQMLQVRLKNAYNFHIQGVLTSRDAINYDFSNIDLIISTAPIQNLKQKYVLVNPLLNDEDYVQIGYKISEIRNNGKSNFIEADKVDLIMREIDPLILEFQKSKTNNLSKSIRKVIYKQLKKESNENPYLYEFLPASHIQLDVIAKDWKEAIQLSARPLLMEGYITENYIQALIDNIREYGDYVVFAPQFAIPHESYDKGCKRAGMNLIRLVSPVRFGDKEDAGMVKFICTLCTTNRTIHLKAFFHFVNLLKNQKFRTDLEEAKTSTAVAELIKLYEIR
ncbi:MAG: PTS sugar transporter subunit IIA [Erysipelotrichaceae bacterium]